MKNWVKFYTESLHDRKIRKLSERDQLVFFKLVLLAGYEDLEGELPSDDDIALELYMKTSEIKKSLRNLIDAGLLYVNDDGVTVVTNFEKRQNQSLSDAERSQRYRANRKNVTEQRDERHATVTENCEHQCDGEQKIVTLEKNRVEEEKNRNREEEEKIKKNNKKKSDADASTVTQQNSKRDALKEFGEFGNVKLSDKEYNQLCEKYGTQGAENLIRKLDNYIEVDESGQTRKKYAKRNHNLTLQNWAEREGIEVLKTTPKPKPKEESWIERAERIEAEMNGFEGVSLLDKLSKGDVIDL